MILVMTAGQAEHAADSRAKYSIHICVNYYTAITRVGGVKFFQLRGDARRRGSWSYSATRFKLVAVFFRFSGHPLAAKYRSNIISITARANNSAAWR